MLYLQEPLSNRFRNATRKLKFTPGVPNPAATAADPKSHTLTPSAESKGNKAKTGPTFQLKTVPSSPRAGTGVGSNGNSPLSMSTTSISPKPRLTSLSQSVYSHKRASEALEQMSHYAPFSTTEEPLLQHQEGSSPRGEADQVEEIHLPEPVDLRLEEDDLLDLFSPLNLTSIRDSRAAGRKRDLFKSSNIRDYFSVFVQKEVPVPAAEEVKVVPVKKEKPTKPGVVASGVGMPKAEKAFLASYSNTNRGLPGNAIQTNDGLINLTTVTTVSPTNSGPTASYQTPTLSYSWRLATRRKSTTAVDMNAAAAAAAAAAVPSPRSHQRSSPLPHRREWSPPPRSRPSPGMVSASGNKSTSPSRSALTPVADPSDTLGLDKAIEKLQMNLGPRGNGRRSSLF